MPERSNEIEMAAVISRQLTASFARSEEAPATLPAGEVQVAAGMQPKC